MASKITAPLTRDEIDALLLAAENEIKRLQRAGRNPESSEFKDLESAFASLARAANLDPDRLKEEAE